MKSPPVVGVVAFDLEENKSVLWSTADSESKMTRFDCKRDTGTDSEVLTIDHLTRI